MCGACAAHAWQVLPLTEVLHMPVYSLPKVVVLHSVMERGDRSITHSDTTGTNIVFYVPLILVGDNNFHSNYVTDSIPYRYFNLPRIWVHINSV